MELESLLASNRLIREGSSVEIGVWRFVRGIYYCSVFITSSFNFMVDKTLSVIEIEQLSPRDETNLLPPTLATRIDRQGDNYFDVAEQLPRLKNT